MLINPMKGVLFFFSFCQPKMISNRINSVSSLLLKLFLIISLNIATASGNNARSRIAPSSHYRPSKNIAFGAFGGGRSHLMWVFEILEEAHTRGHQVFFYSRASVNCIYIAIPLYLDD